jgi:hypothetical protein
MLARNPSAAAKRRYRRRLRAGRIVLRIEVAECELAEALIRAERLTTDESADRAVLTREAMSIIEDFIGRFDVPRQP